MKLIIFILYSTILFSDNSLFDMSGQYRICKKPIDLSSSLYKKFNNKLFIIDNEELEKVFLNPQHFHFFKTKKYSSSVRNYRYNQYLTWDINNNYINWIYEYNSKTLKSNLSNMPINISSIDNSCIINNFSNFGFFADSKIHCNQDIKDYSSCSTKTFTGEELSLALNMLLTDFYNRKYSLKDYNCQTFIENLLASLEHTKRSNVPACLACPSCWINNDKSYFEIFYEKNITSLNKIYDIKWQSNNNLIK